MTLLQGFNLLFILVGLSFSFFYGFKAYRIFDVSKANKTLSWRFHQFWYNFLGSAIGWACAWLVARKVWHLVNSQPTVQLVWSDFALIAVAFVGLTGHLPYAAAGTLEGLNRLASKITGIENK